MTSYWKPFLTYTASHLKYCWSKRRQTSKAIKNTESEETGFESCVYRLASVTYKFALWIWISYFCYNAVSSPEKAMAPHSSVLAWRIPGTGEPGGLPSVGLHRVGHYWSDLAASAAAVSSPIKKRHAFGEMQIKTKIRYQFTLIRIKNEKIINSQ